MSQERSNASHYLRPVLYVGAFFVAGVIFFGLNINRTEAAISYVGGAEASGNIIGYDVSLTGLTGGSGSAAAAGDLVIVSTGWVGTADGNPGVSTAGYTEITDLHANDTRDAEFSVNWKVMGSSPDTTVSCNGSGLATNGAVCVVHVWRGVNITTPMDVTETETSGINAATPNSPSITPVTSGAIVISTGLATGAANDTSVTAPTGYGNQVDISVDPGNAAIVGIASKAWSGSGAEDPAAWTNFTTSTSDSWAANTLALRPAITTLGDGTDGGNSTIGPDGSATEIDRFSLVSTGYNETVTGMTVTLAGNANAYQNIATVDVQTTGSSSKCSNSSLSSNSVALISCAIAVTSSATDYKIMITPKTHANMPAVPGASYATTATVTAITATYTTTGTDTDSATITVDNASAANVTSTSGSAGSTQVTLDYTNPADSDLNSIVVLRRAGSAVTDVPVEGTAYTGGETIGSATVATGCVDTSVTPSAAENCTATGLTNGTAYHFKIFTKDSRGNYDAGVVPTGSPFTPAVAGITISGTAYQTNESTALGSNKTVALRVNGTLGGTGDGGTGLDDTDTSGNWSFTGVGASAGDTITIYLNGETEKANTITITDGSTNITSTPLYDGHVVIRSDNGAAAITILDLVDYDIDNNATDMLFTATDATPDTLVIANDNELHIFDGDTFTPGGTVTTGSSASSSSVGGDMHIDGTAILSMGTNALSVGGDFNNEGTFSYSSGQTTIFTATSTGFTVQDGTSNFHVLNFNGTGGEWTLQSALSPADNLTVTAGALVTGSSITGASSKTFQVNNGAAFRLTGSGSYPTGFTTYTFQPTSTMQYQGSSITIAVATYGHLTLGGTATYTLPASDLTVRGNMSVTADATVVKSASNKIIFDIGGGGTQTLTGNNVNSDLGLIQVSANSGNTTVNADANFKATSVTIDASQTLSLVGSRTLTLTSNSTPLTISGTLTDTDDTIVFAPGSAGTVTVPTRTYYTVTVDGVSSIFRPGSGTLTINNNLNVTNGTLDLNTNDPATSIGGTLTIGGTLSASTTSNLTFSGSTWTNNGTFTSNNGTVIVAPSGGVATIAGSAATNFHDFIMTSSSAGKAIRFRNGAATGFSGIFSIAGLPGNPIWVNSDSAGTQWQLNLSGTSDLTFINLADSGCLGGTNSIILHESVQDLGNNSNSCWKFKSRGSGSGAVDGGPGGGNGQGGGGSGGGGGGSDGGSGGSSALPETFSNNNGTALTTHNSSWTLLNGNFAINTNAVYSNTAVTDTMAAWNATAFSNDQYAEITVTVIASSSYIGVAVRTQDGSHSGYGVYCNSVELKLIEWNTGTPTTHYTGIACAANDLLRLESVGSTIVLKLNGYTIAVVSDSTYNSGKPGLVGRGNASTTRGDGWTAGSASGGGGGGGVSP